MRCAAFHAMVAALAGASNWANADVLRHESAVRAGLVVAGAGACMGVDAVVRGIQNGASPSIVVRFSRRRRWSGVPPARCISERLSQNTMSPGCQRWR